MSQEKQANSSLDQKRTMYKREGGGGYWGRRGRSQGGKIIEVRMVVSLIGNRPHGV